MGKIVEILFEFRNAYSMPELIVITIPLMFLIFCMLMLGYAIWFGNIFSEVNRVSIMFLPLPMWW